MVTLVAAFGGAGGSEASRGAAGDDSAGRLVIQIGNRDDAVSVRPSDGSSSPFGVEQPIALSRDGDRVAYMTSDDDGVATIRVRDADGTDVLAGTVHGTIREGGASFSGDGSQLALLVLEPASGAEVPGNAIMVLDSDGSTAPRTIVRDDGEGSSDSPSLNDGVSWNPVDDEIAFVRGARIGLISPDGGAVTDFAGNCPWRNQAPHCPESVETGFFTHGPIDFAPDGGRIAFEDTGFVQGQEDDVKYAIATRGSAVPDNIVDVPDGDGGYFARGHMVFSPDGASVAYWIDDSTQNEPPSVYVGSAEGGPGTFVRRGEPLVAWQNCPDGTCPLFARGDDPVASKVTLDHAAGRRIRLSGRVQPSAKGSRVTVSLERRKGTRWVRVGKATPRLDGASRFASSFPAPNATQCRGTVRFAGNDELLASSATEIFRC